MSANKKNYSLCYLRAAACVAIIVIHTVYSCLIVYQNTLDSTAAALYKAVVNNMMWAVPSFLMVSSGLLLNPQRQMTYEKILKKYVLRIIEALIFFGIIYSLCDMWMNGDASLKAFGMGMYRIFAGTSWSHLWYLYCLIGLYLMLPLFRGFIAVCDRKGYRGLLLVLLLFLSIVPLLKELGLEVGLYIPVSGIYPLYFLGGYYLIQSEKTGRRGLKVLVILLCTAVITGLTWLQICKGVAVPENLFGYGSIFVICQSVSIFLLVISFSPKAESIAGKILLSLDRYSFSIYLIHLIFIRILLRVVQFNPFPYGPGLLALLVFGDLLLSWGIAWILKKLPVLRTFL